MQLNWDWNFWPPYHSSRDEDPKFFPGSGSGSAEKSDTDPDPTLIRNEKKIFIYFNEKKYLCYLNSSPQIRSFGFIQEFS